MSAQKIILATISGVLTGVAVGLLIAPAKGSETRQKIAETAGDFAGDIKTKVKDFTAKASVKLDDLKSSFENEIEGLGNDVREKILKLMDQGKTAAAKVKQEATNIKDGANQNNIQDGANQAANA